MSKQPSSPSRQYTLSGSTHLTEDTETADPSQKPLVIINNFVVCITVNYILPNPHLQASSANPILLNEESGHQLVVQPAVLETPTDRSSTTMDSEKPLLVAANT